MGYDISLIERSTGETIELPFKHIMAGATCCAEYDEKTGKFFLKPTAEAWLSVTYNYSKCFKNCQHLLRPRLFFL